MDPLNVSDSILETQDASSPANPTPTENQNPSPIQVSGVKAENGSAGKKKSYLWSHFTLIPGRDPKDPMCSCNYCGAQYKCHSRKHGTSSMKVHFEHQCKKKSTQSPG
ncbi:unnamed protein product [Cuscuta epithymum]|uniref:BED-type domain-containing protein n=1 Tax=Cuscuta epithymum TaxID=186058 RepID=A0AAV0C5R6_9ASTE|nr:unnamed protein product [Cuscuta epithymum]CAH9134906.1 unnamed protein product [Cuscuta epithymum]